MRLADTERVVLPAQYPGHSVPMERQRLNRYYASVDALPCANQGVQVDRTLQRLVGQAERLLKGCPGVASCSNCRHCHSDPVEDIRGNPLYRMA